MLSIKSIIATTAVIASFATLALASLSTQANIRNLNLPVIGGSSSSSSSETTKVFRGYTWEIVSRYSPGVNTSTANTGVSTQAVVDNTPVTTSSSSTAAVLSSVSSSVPNVAPASSSTPITLTSSNSSTSNTDLPNAVSAECSNGKFVVKLASGNGSQIELLALTGAPNFQYSTANNFEISFTTYSPFSPFTGTNEASIFLRNSVPGISKLVVTVSTCGNNGTISSSSSNNTVSSNPYFSTNCDTGFEQQMLTLVNDYRVQNGKAALTLDSNLNGVACAHTIWMTANGLSHTGFEGSTPFQRCSRALANFTCHGENVGYSSTATAQQFFNGYKNSPSHNANMLSSQYTKVGFAKKGIYNTQLFKN